MAGKILVIDSVMPNRIILKVKLSGAGYDVRLAASGREGLETALQQRPDLIILDMDLPDISAEDMMAQLRQLPSLRQTLVIMLSANGGIDTRLRAYRAGCDEYYDKPYREATLLARLRSFFREDEQLRMLSAQGKEKFPHDIAAAGFFEDMHSFAPAASVAIFGAPEAALHLKRKLTGMEASIGIFTPESVTNTTQLSIPMADAVIVLSDNTDPNAALHLISTLRGHAQTRDARFCLQFDEGARAADRDLAFDFGADAIFLDSDHPEEMSLRLAGLIKRKHRADALRERIKTGFMLSMRDPLTNIPNRRYMLAAMRSFMARAQQESGSVAVIMCDVDRFKSVNDQFGHAVGDDVLREMAKRLGESLREGDLIARIGGEEFLVALPRATMGEARAVAERMVSAVRAKPFSVENAPPMLMTVSAGLAMAIPQQGTNIDTIIAASIDEADRAMLLSKSQGRDKITLGLSAA